MLICVACRLSGPILRREPVGSPIREGEFEPQSVLVNYHNHREVREASPSTQSLLDLQLPLRHTRQLEALSCIPFSECYFPCFGVSMYLYSANMKIMNCTSQRRFPSIMSVIIWHVLVAKTVYLLFYISVCLSLVTRGQQWIEEVERVRWTVVRYPATPVCKCPTARYTEYPNYCAFGGSQCQQSSLMCEWVNEM